MKNRRIALARRRFRFYIILSVLFMTLTIKTYKSINLRKEFVKAKAEMHDIIEETSSSDFEICYFPQETFEKYSYTVDNLFFAYGLYFEIVPLEEAPKDVKLIKKEYLGRVFYVDADKFK